MNLNDAGLLSVLLIALTLCGCRTAENATILVSRVKSPISITTKPVNSPLAAPVTPQTPDSVEPEWADTFFDLKKQPVVTVVAVSGGGVRATRLAVHTMAALETEWEASRPREFTENLRDRIDIWSTVSGGSLFASWVAETQRLQLSKNAFRWLAADRFSTRLATQQMGGMSATFYLSPGNLGYAPLMLFFSEWDTVNLFARTHAMSQNLHHIPIMSVNRLPSFGDLNHRPRFFFNATLSQNGRPMVFTNALIHGFQEEPRNLPEIPNPLERWLQDGDLADNFSTVPLPYATTLEDIGSSPARFPVAYAAMASAAFPVAFDPLPLTYYGSARSPGSAHHRVSIVDGGIYDNTGGVTALELIEHIARSSTGAQKPRFVLLLIDANLDVSDDLTIPDKAERRYPVKLGFPFRGFVPATRTISTLYMGQKNLTKAVLKRRISQLKEERLDGAKMDLRVVDLDLAKLYADHSRAGEPLYPIPTDFVITKREDIILQRLVEIWSKSESDEQGGKTNAQAFVDFVETDI